MESIIITMALNRASNSMFMALSLIMALLEDFDYIKKAQLKTNTQAKILNTHECTYNQP